MAIFTDRIDVTSQPNYGSAPDVIIPFTPKSILVVAEGTAADELFASFDGVTDHARMLVGDPTAGWRFEQRGLRIWVRRGTVSSNAFVRITAER